MGHGIRDTEFSIYIENSITMVFVWLNECGHIT
jgi:hypothetical protein